MKKNNEIQIIRAFAVLLTLCEHLSLISPMPLSPIRSYLAFWPSVDIFLVVSGYVITCSLYPFLDAVDRRGAVWVELKIFWYKRAFRVLPAAWLWLLIATMLALQFQGNMIFPSFFTTLRDVAAALLNYANFHWAWCWVNSGFGQVCSGPGILSHYWSLSLEEQFYLLYPLALLFFKGRLRIILLVALAVLLATATRGPLGFGWHARIDGLVFGALLGLALRNGRKPQIESRAIILALRCLAPVLLLVILWWGTAGYRWYIAAWDVPPPFWLTLMALMAAILVFLAIFEQQLIWVPRRIRKVLLVIGERSYGLYLAHLPIYALVKSIAIDAGLAQSAGGICLQIILGVGFSFLLAEITYRYVENPSRLYGAKLANRLRGKSTDVPARSSLSSGFS
jgi:peptidoglycan/LPS O-acetylase OafA/YrhL